jgi:hypothetical protein
MNNGTNNSTNNSTNNDAPPPTEPALPAWARKQQMADPLTDERLAAFIGPRSAKYARKLAAFRIDPAFTPTWNWSAALFQAGWFIYRKMYLAALAFMIVPGFVFRLLTNSDAQMTLAELQKPENEWLALVQFGVGLSSIIAAGGVANWLLFRRARAAAYIAAAQGAPVEEERHWLVRVGGVNNFGVILAGLVFLMSMYAAMKA